MREKWGKMGKIADPESPNIHYLYSLVYMSYIKVDARILQVLVGHMHYTKDSKVFFTKLHGPFQLYLHTCIPKFGNHNIILVSQ